MSVSAPDLTTPRRFPAAHAVETVTRSGSVEAVEHRRGWSSTLLMVLPAAELAAMVACVAGGALFGATVLIGRTSALRPSLVWLATVVGVGVLLAAIWCMNWLLAPGSGWGRAHAAGWPMLALLPAALAGAALYFDEQSNHLVREYAPTRQALLSYGFALPALAEAAYWVARLQRRSTAGATYRGAFPLVALSVAAAAYVNASVFLQWIPTQTDLHVNLAGARDLFAGDLPYRDWMPVWADRVHMLPVTLALLFGPFTLLPDWLARAVFFLGNQALWLAAMWLLIRHLAPPASRIAWLAGALVLGAVYWPWQEAIRFGQQDGLLILLYVYSFLAVAAGRERAGGIALGAALIVKPLSIWLPLAYLLHGRWRTLAVAAATAATLAVLALPLTGLSPWWHFASVELPAMLSGTVRGTNIPLASIHARLFVGREALANGDPAPSYPVIQALNLAASALGLLAVLRLRLHPEADRGRAWLLDACFGLTLTLLLAPMAWQHYASWLSIAFIVLASPITWRPLDGPARVGAATLAGPGFLLLSLNDDKLLSLLEPWVERWPAVLSFYAAGLLCVAGAVAVARLAGSAKSPQFA